MRFPGPAFVPVALAALLALALSACAKPAFTRAVRDRYALADSDVRRIQFYTSEEIVLQREITEQTKSISSNELVVRDGVRIEEIVIPARTPGVALRVEGDYLLVGFARQRPDLALWFALARSDSAPSPELRRYQLAELENTRDEAAPFQPRWATGFLVSWGGARYRVASGRGAYLLYEMEASFAREKSRQKAPGWRLSDGVPASSSANAPAAPAPR
jgi:hypothetical protein